MFRHLISCVVYTMQIARPVGYRNKFGMTPTHTDTRSYETLLGKKLDIRNFPKKLVYLGLIKKLNEKRNIGPHRAPFLYKFDLKKYTKTLETGTTLT